MSAEKKVDVSEALLFLQKLGVELGEIKLVVPLHKWSQVENELKKEENKKFREIIQPEDVKGKFITGKIPIGQF